MIEKVGLGDVRVKNIPSNFHISKNADKRNPLNPLSVMNYMNYSSFPLINFKGLSSPVSYRNKTDNEDFDATINFNYFQLPKIKLKDGNVIQAMPDKTQYACAKSLYEGDNTVCIAPTGTGKTAIANYVITKNLYDDKKTYYTTPLKALSNDKYREFCKIYGEDNVGLMTGDIKLKKDAPIVIMTTEIYRNMALGAYANDKSKRFDDVQTVIFDEAHYINEEDRGRIWEESMMLTPSSVQILPLSATIGNGDEFSNWIGNISDKKTTLVEASPKDRHVPLVYYNYVRNDKKPFKELIQGDVDIPSVIDNLNNHNLSQRQIRALDLLYRAKHEKDIDFEAKDNERDEILTELNTSVKGKRVPHKQFATLIQGKYRLSNLDAQEISQLLLDSDSRSITNAQSSKEDNELGQRQNNDYTDLVTALERDKKLPAIIFKFSRSGCNDSAETLLKNSVDLTTEKEKTEIKKIINEYKKQGIYFGKGFNEKALINGIAPHHAGLLPSYKKLVEDLFSKKLLKVVIATSTLSAGINMPAKTVVITDVNRPDGNMPDELEAAAHDGIYEEELTPLSANEFHQMAGRAGRRGVDTIGNVVLYNLKDNQQQIAQRLILKSADPLLSKYSPSYCFLTAYHQRYNDDKLLNYFQNNTLKVFQAEDKNSTLNELKEDFERYRGILVKEKFLEKIGDGYRVTPKGQMLTKAHGYDELTLVNMIFNKDLKKASVEELAGFAGAMAGASEPEEDDEILFSKNVLIKNDGEAEKSSFFTMIEKARMLDDRQENLEASIGIDKHSDVTSFFAAQIAYRFASLNMENEKNGSNSINNFKQITSKPKNNFNPEDDLFDDVKTYKEQVKNYSKKLEDGDIYRILSQSVDVLKQIINISEFALEDESFKDDTKYYEKLLDKAHKALALIQQPPVCDAISVA